MPPLDDEIFESYMKAGKAVASALKLAPLLARPGTKLIDLATLLESEILKNGAESWSFPINLSLNDIAAHYSPVIDDQTILPNEGLLKVDCGAHYDGYVADAAVTVNLGKNDGVNQQLIEASQNALYAAIQAFKPGVNIKEIGAVIHNEIDKFEGIKPISNLGGHQLKHWSLHAGTFVPNVRTSMENYVIQEGDQFAIEPFTTNGFGAIRNGRDMTIFQVENIHRKKNIPMQEKLRLKKFKENFNSFPFSPRWIDFIPKEDVNSAINKYYRQGIIDGYHTFIERGHGLVSQSEHTVIVTKDGAVPTTWWEDFDINDWKPN